MQFNFPGPRAKDDGDYDVYANPGWGAGPFATIDLDGRRTSLVIQDIAEARRLLKAAAAAKRYLEAIAAGTPHAHEPSGVYTGACAVCGLISQDAIHAEPESAACPAVADNGHPCTGTGPLHPLPHRTAEGYEFGDDDQDGPLPGNVVATFPRGEGPAARDVITRLADADRDVNPPSAAEVAAAVRVSDRHDTRRLITEAERYLARAAGEDTA